MRSSFVNLGSAALMSSAADMVILLQRACTLWPPELVIAPTGEDIPLAVSVCTRIRMLTGDDIVLMLPRMGRQQSTQPVPRGEDGNTLALIVQVQPNYSQVKPPITQLLERGWEDFLLVTLRPHPRGLREYRFRETKVGIVGSW